jgi:hypothetical protein
MTFKKTLQAAVAALAFGAAGFASAAVTTLTFEGVGDVNPIGSYYNGGAGGDLGIEFSASSLALVDSDAGGQGDFANEPGPGSTVMFFLDADSAYLNYAAGFTGGFAFYYSSEVATIVEVWDGLNGGGNRIGFITLDAQFQAQSLTNPDGCSGDPNGKYCNWTLAGLAFTETARSVSFTATPCRNPLRWLWLAPLCWACRPAVVARSELFVSTAGAMGAGIAQESPPAGSAARGFFLVRTVVEVVTLSALALYTSEVYAELACLQATQQGAIPAPQVFRTPFLRNPTGGPGRPPLSPQGLGGSCFRARGLC